MRNPWVHDDISDNSSYDGRVRLVAAVVWGTLVVGVGGFVLLSGLGVVNVADSGSIGSVLTGVVTALVLALAMPVILKLLAISRVLAAAVFLGTGGLVGRFVIAREPDRVTAVLAAGERVAADAGAVGDLLDAVDAAASAMSDAVVWTVVAVVALG